MMKSMMLALSVMLSFGGTGCVSTQPLSEGEQMVTGSTFKEAEVVMKAKVISDKDDELLLAEMDEENSSLYVISSDTPAVDGKEILPGAIVNIGYDGMVLETYPGQIANPEYIQFVEQEPDLVGLYRIAFGDIYGADSGLNDGVQVLAFDLTKAGNLSDEEKQALLYLMWVDTQIETRLGTRDELIEEGLIIAGVGNPGYFEAGILFSIDVTAESAEEIAFDIEKWRSGTGAYGFSNCIATPSADGWTYEYGGAWIS